MGFFWLSLARLLSIYRALLVSYGSPFLFHSSVLSGLFLFSIAYESAIYQINSLSCNSFVDMVYPLGVECTQAKECLYVRRVQKRISTEIAGLDKAKWLG